MIKKYKLLQFLNQKHNMLIRGIFATAGFSGTFILSWNLKLARRSFQDFWSDKFKVATRRAGWIANRTINVQIIDDKIYNFTEDLTMIELVELDKFIKSKISQKPDCLLLKSDQLYIMAAMMEQDPSLFGELKSEFENNASFIVQNATINLSQNLTNKQKSREADFSLEDAHSALVDFNKIYSPKEWNWFLVSGTFLGLFRDGGFMAHDYDLDFGVFSDGFNIDLFLERLQKSPDFFLRKVDYQRSFVIADDQMRETRRIPALIKIIHRSNVNLDIFIHYKEGEICWHGSSFHRWENSLFNLVPAVLEGVDVLVPENADLYLTENYGDWRTPIKDFNCSTGTPNLTLVKNPSSVCLFLRRMSVHKDNSEIIHNHKILESAGLIDKDEGFKLNLS